MCPSPVGKSNEEAPKTRASTEKRAKFYLDTPKHLQLPEQVSCCHGATSHGVWLFCHIRNFGHHCKLIHSKDLRFSR